MIRLRTETQPGHGSRPEPRDRPCCYGIAGSTVETSSPEVAFEGLEIPCDTQEDRQPMPRRRSAAPGTEEQVIFEGDVELGGGVRRGRTVRRGETVRFEVETLGDVTIAAGVSSCEVQVRPYPGVARGSRGWQELVAGPALTLPLTLDGVVCLHASGVLAPAGAVAFFGSSGQGKSTLAVGLGAELPRIADDILPLARVTKTSRAGFVALPRFPQLKLPPAQRVSPDLPPRLPVAALFELETLPGEERLASLSVEPLPSRQAVAALVASSVGPRVLGSEVLAAHFSFCCDLAAQIPVFRLSYPRRTDALPGVREAILSVLAPGPRIT